MLKMTSDKEGVSEKGRRIEAGTTVEYLGHVIGGMVKIKLPDGSEEIVNPRIFPELR